MLRSNFIRRILDLVSYIHDNCSAVLLNVSVFVTYMFFSYYTKHSEVFIIIMVCIALLLFEYTLYEMEFHWIIIILSAYIIYTHRSTHSSSLYCVL